MSVFTTNNMRNIRRNPFDLSYEHKTSTQFGKLTPFFTQEVLPGDSFNVNSEIFSRFAPMLSPVMHRVDIKTEFFYVPYYSIWDKWQDFISGGENYDQNPTAPYIEYNEANKHSFKNGTLADTFGFPVWDKDGTAPTVTGTQNINALPFKAYQHIYNEWYRDQDLEGKIDIYKSTDGLTSINVASQRTCSWEKDYFTSARPTAQKSDPVNFLNYLDKSEVYLAGGSTPTAGAVLDVGTLGELEAGSSDARIENISGTTVQDLRRAEAVQSYLERLQRSGNRYREHLAGIWGVKGADQRLQIPEYLGGGKQKVTISEVLTTSNNDNTTTDNNTAGQQYGTAISVGNGHGFRQKFTDHGIIIGILRVVPKPAYSEGLHRMWQRADRFDYFQPDLALIGEQEIEDKELWFSHNSPTGGTGTFGYQQRYADWKYKADQVTGDMRFNLDYWHLSRPFGGVPTLNTDFIKVETLDDNLNRIFNVIDPDIDPIWIQVYNKVQAVRPIPYQSIPDLG